MTTPPPRRERGTWRGKAVGFAVGVAAGAAAGYAITDRAETAPVPAGDLGPGVASWPQLLQGLRTGVCVLDGADRIAHANAGALELGIDDGMGHLSDDRLRALAARVRSTGVPQDADIELDPAGESVAVRVHGSPLPSEHVTIELMDVSELHRVERMRRDFVANVSHELKTPVGALQLLAEALADAVDDPQAAERFITRIQHESARMSRLVSELLELSRLQGAEPMPPPEPVSVDRVISEALDRGRTAAGAKNIKLLRTGTRGLTVSGAESQLATAIGNLVGNAVAYSPDDTTVTVSAAARHGWVRVQVADEGIGIAPEDAERIFERFYRADPARSRATGGTGLGLAIVKHIVGNHGGKVEVSSMPGNGATFTLTLPSVTSVAPRTEPGRAAIGDDSGHRTR